MGVRLLGSSVISSACVNAGRQRDPGVERSFVGLYTEGVCTQWACVALGAVLFSQHVQLPAASVIPLWKDRLSVTGESQLSVTAVEGNIGKSLNRSSGSYDLT